MKTDKIMADFQFLNNKVTEFNIQNNLLNTNDKMIKIDCDMDYEVISCNEVEDGFLGTIDFIVDLSGKIEDSEAFKIHLIMRGNFVGSKGKNNFGEMLEVNGTATLSQLSRAYLTSVTALSGMSPINLPMVNIYAMKKYKEK